MSRLRDDRGMTIIEVMMASLVLIVGVVGTFSAFDGVTKLGTLSEKKQSATRYVQSEMEALRSLGWTNTRLSATPAPFSDTRGTVAGGVYNPPGGQAQSLVVAAAGVACTSTTCINPGPESWSYGNATGSVYRFVTSSRDTTCGSACPEGGIDRLRITVAVTINGPYAPKAAIVSSTLVIDPTAAPSNAVQNSNPVSSTAGSTIGGATGTTYYLSDTPVGQTYAAPVTAHATRATVGATGVPDQLRTTVPDTPSTGSALPPSFSTDLSPGVDGGLSIEGSSSCNGTSVTKAHTWATPVLNASAAVTATGNAALSLPTRLLDPGDGGGAGRICLDVYSVALAANNTVSASTLLGSYSYQLPDWPDSTELIAFPFRYLAQNTTASISAGRRLMVQMRADSQYSKGLIVAYDHPNYPASIQLETQ